MSLVRKRSVTIRGHRTSFSLEQPFYDDLLVMADERGLSLAALVGEIDAARPRDANLVIRAAHPGPRLGKRATPRLIPSGFCYPEVARSS